MDPSKLEQKALAAAQPRMHRRSFLKIGLAGTALAAVGGVGLALRKSFLREIPKGGLQVLSQKEYSIFAAIADAICPALGPGAPGASALAAGAKADALLAKMDADAQKDFKILLSLFDNALFGFLTDGRITPFSKLSLAEQQRSFEKWGSSRLAFRRGAYVGLRGLVTAVYYGDEGTWERIGYPGPPDVSSYREWRRTQLEAEAAGAPTPAQPPAPAKGAAP